MFKQLELQQGMLGVSSYGFTVCSMEEVGGREGGRKGGREGGREGRREVGGREGKGGGREG